MKKQTSSKPKKQKGKKGHIEGEPFGGNPAGHHGQKKKGGMKTTRGINVLGQQFKNKNQLCEIKEDMKPPRLGKNWKLWRSEKDNHSKERNQIGAKKKQEKRQETGQVTGNRGKSPVGKEKGGGKKRLKGGEKRRKSIL